MSINEITQGNIKPSDYTDKINEIIRGRNNTAFFLRDFPKYAWKEKTLSEDTFCYTLADMPSVNDSIYDNEGNLFGIPAYPEELIRYSKIIAIIENVEYVDISAEVQYGRYDETLETIVTTRTVTYNFRKTETYNLPTKLIDNQGNVLDLGYSSKSGDIIEGNVNIFNHGINLYNGDLIKGTLPASDYWMTIAFNDSTNSDTWQDTRLGCIETQIGQNGTNGMFMRAYRNNASSSEGAYIGVYQPQTGQGYTYAPTPADNDVSNKIATTQFVNKAADGQWVIVPRANNNIYEGSLYHATKQNLPRTVNKIPNDGYDYEALINARVTTGNQTGNAIAVSIKTNKLGEWTWVCGARTRANGTAGNRGSTIVPIRYGTDNFTINRDDGYTGTAVIEILAYRRIGKNT